jgi:hypothetical protein
VSTIDQPLRVQTLADRIAARREIVATGLIAVGWCVAITLVGYLWARNLYDRDPAR